MEAVGQQVVLSDDGDRRHDDAISDGLDHVADALHVQPVLTKLERGVTSDPRDGDLHRFLRGVDEWYRDPVPGVP